MYIKKNHLICDRKLKMFPHNFPIIPTYLSSCFIIGLQSILYYYIEKSLICRMQCGREHDKTSGKSNRYKGNRFNEQTWVIVV